MNMKHICTLILLLFAATPMMTGCRTLSESEAMQAGSTSDSQITDDILQRLRDDTVTGRTTFNVEVQNGVATLRGIVREESVKGRALGIARGTPGVVDVIDAIQLR
jgi:osmotically-inducible protein OsmY